MSEQSKMSVQRMQVWENFLYRKNMVLLWSSYSTSICKKNSSTMNVGMMKFTFSSLLMM